MQTAVTYRGRRKLLPSGWDEAGPVAWSILRALARHPPGAGKLEAMRLLTGLSKRQFRRLSEAEIVSLNAGLPWLKITPIRACIRSHFRCGWRRYYLPEERFTDGQALAYALADEYFMEAVGATDPATALTANLRLLATLARPRRGTQRAELADREEVERRAERFRRLPPEWGFQVLMYWAGIRQLIDEYYGDWLFRGSPLDKPAAGKIPNFGWWAVFQDVAEVGVFGDLEAVYRANFHEICQWRVRKEAMRRSQQLELENQRTR
jgi:hypothetical protein